MDALKNLVVFEDMNAEERKECADVGFEVYTMAEIIAKGKAAKQEGRA